MGSGQWAAGLTRSGPSQRGTFARSSWARGVVPSVARPCVRRHPAYHSSCMAGAHPQWSVVVLVWPLGAGSNHTSLFWPQLGVGNRSRAPLMAKAPVSPVWKRFMSGPGIVTKCCLYMNTADASSVVQPDRVLLARHAARPFVHGAVHLSAIERRSLTCTIAALS